MDQFKKYLRENRHELDVESPPSPAVWQHIQQAVPVQKKMVALPLFRWIAAACILLITGAVIYTLWPAKQGSEFTSSKPETGNLKPETSKSPEITGRPDSMPPAISPLPGEVIAVNAETSKKQKIHLVSAKRQKNVRPAPLKKQTPVDMLQDSYATIINVQLKKLQSTPIHVESPGYFHAFKKQWYDMEKDEKKLKEDISLYGLNDAVLSQFVQLYQQKLLLLKQLQEEINKMNNRAQQHPEMQSKSPSFLKM